MGLLMITHLDPVNAPSQPLPTKTKDQVGLSLLDHCDRYITQGFKDTRVTSDGEPSIKSVRTGLLKCNIELNMLGHGSHLRMLSPPSAISRIKPGAQL